MKKFIILLLCFIIVFVLSACSYNVIYNSDSTQQLEQPEQNVEPNIKSEIIETDITSATFGKHYSLFVEFEDSEIDLESVKKEITKIIEKNKRTNTVLWIYASTSHRNTIMDNWITYAIYVPKELSEYNEWYSDDEADENGVYWVDNSMMKELETSYAKYFDTEENVASACATVYNEGVELFNILNDKFAEQTAVTQLNVIQEYRDEIIALDEKATAIKYSENDDINQIAEHCVSATSYLRSLIDLLNCEEDNLSWHLTNIMTGCHDELLAAQNKGKQLNRTQQGASQ